MQMFRQPKLRAEDLDKGCRQLLSLLGEEHVGDETWSAWDISVSTGFHEVRSLSNPRAG